MAVAEGETLGKFCKAWNEFILNLPVVSFAPLSFSLFWIHGRNDEVIRQGGRGVEVRGAIVNEPCGLWPRGRGPLNNWKRLLSSGNMTHTLLRHRMVGRMVVVTFTGNVSNYADLLTRCVCVSFNCAPSLKQFSLKERQSNLAGWCCRLCFSKVACCGFNLFFWL